MSDPTESYAPFVEGGGGEQLAAADALYQAVRDFFAAIGGRPAPNKTKLDALNRPSTYWPMWEAMERYEQGLKKQ